MNAAAGGAAAAAAIANAIKASGVLVRVSPEDFLEILARQEAPLVVYSGKGFFSFSHKYLVSYKGLAFYAKCGQELQLPEDVEVIMSASIHIPG